MLLLSKLKNETQITESSNIGKYITLTTIVLLASFVAYQNTTSWYTVTFLLLSIIGIITSIAIIKQELGLKTTLGDAFCSGTDDKKDCDAVLTSKGAEIFKGYKLSDFSILYFTGLSLLTFFQISNPAISFTISLFAIPVTLYSLYYQYAVVKKWCLLCLSIVAVLWIQALVPIFTNTYLTDFITFDFVVLGLIALSTIVAWSYIKPLFTDNHQLKNEKIENVKFKRNYTLFESLLNRSPKINTSINNSNEIIFGNPNSNLEIASCNQSFLWAL